MQRTYDRQRGERGAHERDEQNRGAYSRGRSGEWDDRRGSWYGEAGYGSSSEGRGERSHEEPSRRRWRDDDEYESRERYRGGWSGAGEGAFGEEGYEDERRWSSGARQRGGEYGDY